MERLNQIGLAVTERIAALGVLGILGVGVITVADILLRSLFNDPINGLNEITSPLLALGVAACLPAGVMGRVNITIDLAKMVTSPVIFAWLRVFGSLALLVFLAVVSVRLWLLAERMSELARTSAILGLPVGAILKIVTIVLAFSVPMQLIPTAIAAINAYRLNRPVAWVLFILTLLIALSSSAFWPQVYSVVLPLMDMMPASLALTCFGLMWLAIFMNVPLGAAMGLCGLLGSALILGTGPSLAMFGTRIEENLFNDSLAVLPLFLLMGSFATVAGMSGDIYRFAQSVVGHLRGGLAAATVLGSAGFGALTGSSLATSATIGKVALPEMSARNYSRSLAAGTVAAGGTLGQLVPPSTVLVVYALLTEESIGKLFLATIVPALLAVMLYLIAIWVTVAIKPDWAQAGQKGSLTDVVQSLLRGWLAFGLIGLVIGGLYSGIFTETEAASVGAVGAFLVAILRGSLRRNAIWKVMRETTSTIAMVYILIFGATNFSFLIGISGIPDLFISAMLTITENPILIVAMIAVMYLLLGTVMDSFAIMIITVPVFLPLILQFGMDPIWWGIVTICLVETGMITPPFGLNLFVIKSIDQNLKLWGIYRGVIPFILADIVKIVLLIAFPIIALWLPGTR